MTTREFIQAADNHPLILVTTFVLLPLLAWACGRIHGKDRGGVAPWKHIYSVLVYAACVPGLFAAEDMVTGKQSDAKCENFREPSEMRVVRLFSLVGTGNRWRCGARQLFH